MLCKGQWICVRGLLCMLPVRSCASSPASLSCIPQAQHTGWRSTAFLSLVMVVVMAHGATTMTNDVNAVLLQQAGMSHLKDCTHCQQCVSVLAGLSAIYAGVCCFAPSAWYHACFCAEREHVITSAITHPFVTRCTHILKKHHKSDLLPH